MAVKSFEQLNLSDAFLFAAALQDPESCRLILELILDRPVPKVRVHTEHSLLFSPDLRSVRLDVYAADEMQVAYNLEMQNKTAQDLAKRSRFYQAELDVAALKPGEDFHRLRPSFIIFLCTFDPFDRGLYRYTFETRCLEQDFALNDGACRIFLNTKGKNRDQAPKALVDFLRYVEQSNEAFALGTDRRIQALHERIGRLKKSRKWRSGYMRFEELLQDSRQEGHLAGLEEGRQTMLSLVNALLKDGKAHLIPRLEEEPGLVEQLCEQYHL